MSYFQYFWKYAAICSQALFVPSSEYWRIQWSSDSSCTLRSTSMNFSRIIWTFELINHYHGLMVLGGLCLICCHCCDWVFLCVIVTYFKDPSVLKTILLCYAVLCIFMAHFWYLYFIFLGSDIFFITYMCWAVSLV